jgi:hypothetical protein
MEENDAKNNQDEKQNLEEEEYEEDEEEKEQEQNKEDAKEEAKNSKKENEQNAQIENKENENDNPNQQKDEQKEEIKVKENEENQEKKEIVSQKNEKISDKTEQQEEKVEKIEENKTEEKKEEIKNIEENKLNEEIKNNDNDKKEDENGGAKNEEKEVIEEEEEDEEIKDGASTYILKYSRKSNEPRESSYDKELIKSKHCLFMIEFKLMQGKKEKYLLIYCHEIAAIYFDEIYEKKYSIKDLYKENRHFRIFDDVEEAKNIIDEILNNNTSNSKKIFIDLQENMFRLHLKMIFFDKECEIIFNIPKKDINDKERIRLLPGFLKEIQIRMNHLEDENKKLKIESKNMNDNDFLDNTNKNNLNEDDDGEFFGEKDEMNSKKNKSVGGRGYKKKMVKK